MKLTIIYKIILSLLLSSNVLGRRIKSKKDNETPLFFIKNQINMARRFSMNWQLSEKVNLEIKGESIKTLSVKVIGDKLLQGRELHPETEREQIDKIEILRNAEDLEIITAKKVTWEISSILGYGVDHEFIELCAIYKSKDSSTQTSYFFVFDKMSAATAKTLKGEGPSLLRVLLFGYSIDCKEDNPNWLENLFKNDEENQKNMKVRYTSKQILNKSFNDALLISGVYGIKQREYSLISHNCQAYATGLFDALTGETTEKANFVSVLDNDFFTNSYKDIAHIRKIINNYY
jgi:hypothetical protein